MTGNPKHVTGNNLILHKALLVTSVPALAGYICTSCGCLHLYQLWLVTSVPAVAGYICTSCGWLLQYQLWLVTSVPAVAGYICTSCGWLHLYQLWLVTSVPAVAGYICTSCGWLLQYQLFNELWLVTSVPAVADSIHLYQIAVAGYICLFNDVTRSLWLVTPAVDFLVSTIITYICTSCGPVPHSHIHITYTIHNNRNITNNK